MDSFPVFIGLLVYSALALKTHAIDPVELRDVLTRLPEPADRLATWV